MSAASGADARRQRVVLVAAFLTMALIAEAAALGPAVPGVATTLGLSLATAGMLAPLHNAGALLGILWWGRSQGRVPAGRVLAVGATLLLAGALLVIANPGAGEVEVAATASLVAPDARWAPFIALVVAVLLLGLGFGLLDAGINTVVAADGIGVGTLNALHGTYGLAAIGFPLLVGLADLRAVYVVVAVGCLLLLAPVRQATPLRRPPRDGGAAHARSRPWVMMITVAMGVEIGAAAWAAAHLVGEGRADDTASAAVAAYFAAFTATRFVLAPLASRTDPSRVVRGGLLLAAAAALAAWIGPWPVAAWVVVGIGIGPVFPTTLAWLVASHEDDRAATRLMVGGAVGGTLLPAAIGGAVALVGTGAIPVAIALIAVAAWSLARPLPGLQPTTG